MFFFFFCTRTFTVFFSRPTTRIEEVERNGEKPRGEKKWYPTSFRASLLRTHWRTRRVPSPAPAEPHGFAAASNKKSVVCNGTKTNVINGRRLLQFIPYTPGPPTTTLPTERGLRSKATPPPGSSGAREDGKRV